MGKNQAYKAMQRARLGSSSAAPEEIEDGMNGMLLVRPALKHLTRLPGKSLKRSKRCQLDADRARKLAQGRNHSSNRKDRDLKKCSSKKRKHSRRRSSDSSSSSSSSESSSSDEEERESRKSKSWSTKSEKEKDCTKVYN